MGMFDYITIPCPNCGHNIEDQTKAGPRNLNRYTLGTMPPRVAADLADEEWTCGACHVTVRFTVQVSVEPYVYTDNYYDWMGDDV